MEAPAKRRSSQKVFGPQPPVVAKRAPWSNKPRMTAEEVKRVAARERLILQLREHSGTVASRRKILNQKVNDAGLLLWFARQSREAPRLRRGGGNPSPRLTQKYRCGKCDECLVGDCGCCASCLDKPRFGGPGSRKQACLTRRCVYVEKCAELGTRNVES